MTEPSGLPRLSVVVVSHGRAKDLRRALMACALQYARGYELVVVTDGPGLDEIAGLPFANRLKKKRFDDENISAARNVGIAASGGDVIAFVDDDAAPEPTWVSRLKAAFPIRLSRR